MIMKVESFEAIIEALNKAQVRYLVVGGFAVIAYGYGRTTYDVDFVIDLEKNNIERTFAALKSLSYVTSVPITAEQFANAQLRESWIQEKGMKVLKMVSDLHCELPVDIFVYMPFDFVKEYEEAKLEELKPGLWVRFIRIRELIKMKEASGRKNDEDDLEKLRFLLKEEIDETLAD